ncbi:MAG: hypothetical protein AAF915_23580 [Cyanobacteria bacterium P01_D01_bin.50]
MGEAKRRKKLLGDKYGKPHTNEDYKKRNHQLPYPEKVRTWRVTSYNSHTNDYILTCDDHDLQTSFISCLKCDEKLKVGENYNGYKDVENKKLILENNPTVQTPSQNNSQQ